MPCSSSPQTYTVVGAAGQPIGTLSQDFVDRLVDGVSSFLLGGRAWAVLRVRHDDRRVAVEPAPRGRQPTWGGFLPQFLGFEVCRRIRTLLRDTDRPPYLDDAAFAALIEARERFAPVLDPASDALETDSAAEEVRWFTFAGGRVNATLRAAITSLGLDWKVIPDNFVVKIRGEHATEERVREALARIAAPGFWENDRLWAKIAESLPNYRLSKFQPLMPPWIQREVVAAYLLDTERGALVARGR